MICDPNLKIGPYFDVQKEEKTHMEVGEWQNSIWVELQAVQVVADRQPDEVAASASSIVSVLVQRCAKTLWPYPWHLFGFAALSFFLLSTSSLCQSHPENGVLLEAVDRISRR